MPCVHRIVLMRKLFVLQACINVFGKLKVCAQVPNAVTIVPEPVAKNSFSYDVLLLFSAFLVGALCMLVSFVFFFRPWHKGQVPLQPAVAGHAADEIRSDDLCVEERELGGSLEASIARSQAPVASTSAAHADVSFRVLPAEETTRGDISIGLLESENPGVQMVYDYYLPALLAPHAEQEEIECVDGAGEKRKHKDDEGGRSGRTPAETSAPVASRPHQDSGQSADHGGGEDQDAEDSDGSAHQRPKVPAPPGGTNFDKRFAGVHRNAKCHAGKTFKDPKANPNYLSITQAWLGCFDDVHAEHNNTEAARIYVEMKALVDLEHEKAAAAGCLPHLDDKFWDGLAKLKTFAEEDQRRKRRENEYDERGVCTPVTPAQRQNVDAMRDINPIMSLYLELCYLYNFTVSIPSLPPRHIMMNAAMNVIFIISSYMSAHEFPGGFSAGEVYDAIPYYCMSP
jgi:hypothetical protein